MRDVDPTGLVPIVGRCPDCGKVRYRTKRFAKQIARQKHPGEQMSAYECSDGFFHLGHKSAKGKERLRSERPTNPTLPESPTDSTGDWPTQNDESR